MPLGWRVHQKVVQIIREEMNAIGGQEMLCPSSRPPSSGRRPGGSQIPQCSSSRIGAGRRYVLPLSHEETMTFHAREIQLVQGAAAALVPLLDEGARRAAAARRPAARARVHHEGLVLVRPRRGGARRELRSAIAEAYKRIFERCGVDAYVVEAESGIMGGTESLGFLAPTGSGENELMRCENGDYFADIEAARGVPRAPAVPGPSRCAGGDRDAGRGDDRGARRLPRHRSRGDLQGDAGRRRRPRSCSRSFAETTA